MVINAQFHKILQKIRFENPMAQVVRFWPKIGRLDPSDNQIEQWHRSLIKLKSH